MQHPADNQFVPGHGIDDDTGESGNYQLLPVIVRKLFRTKVQNLLVRTRRLSLLCHEEIRLCFDKVREFLETVKPGVKIRLQLCEVTPECSKMCPPSVVN